METVIRGEGIFLRKIEYSDTENIIKWRNSDAVRSHFIDQRLFTKESHEGWLKNYVETGKVDQLIICVSPGRLGVGRNEDGAGKEADPGKEAGTSGIDEENYIPVGSVYIRDIDRTHNKAEYGIFIGEDAARGKGFGSDAARLMIRYCFETLKLHRLFLRVYADNEAAIRSYEHAGFLREACLKDDVFVNGKYHDIVLMGIINPKE